MQANKYNGFYDAISHNDDITTVGIRRVLPPTFKGSPRFYLECFHDGMAITQTYGKPSLFITFTATSHWPEVKKSLSEGETGYDRPDVICRVFNQKLSELMDDLTKKHVLGKMRCF